MAKKSSVEGLKKKKMLGKKRKFDQFVKKTTSAGAGKMPMKPGMKSGMKKKMK